MYNLEFRSHHGSQVTLAIKAPSPSEAERIAWVTIYEAHGPEAALWSVVGVVPSGNRG